LPDSTPRFRLPHVALAAALAACLALAAGFASPPAARADGDPASDVLAAQPLFLPADGGFSESEQIRLTALLSAAQRSGYPIRVALIATPSDLGSVSGLWGKPAAYAQFLGDELSLVYRGSLLVVMPAGFGVASVGGASGGASAAALGVPPRGTPMVAATLSAIQKLAADAGHALPLPAAAPAAAEGGSALGSVDLGSWLALAAGAAAIAAAWGLSLRARPPRPPRLRRAR
jgi:hypothetical protein